MFTTLCVSLLYRIILCVIILVLLCIVYLKCKRQHDSKLAHIAKKLQEGDLKLMPSPPAMPIIGHIHLLRDYEHNPWEGFEMIRKQFGDIVSLKMGIHPMVLVSSHQAMNDILLKKGQIFSNRPNFPRHHIIFGGDKENSLALCNWNNVHEDRRKFCTRGIVPSSVSPRNKLLESIVSRLVKEFIDRLATTRNDALKTTQQAPYRTTKEDILFLTSDIFVDFLCGNTNRQGNETYSHLDPQYKKFIHGCDFVFWDINQSYLMDFLPFLTSLGLGFSYLRKLKRITDFLRDFIDDKIFEPRHIEHLSANRHGEVIEENNNDESGKKLDYLDTIILEHLAKKTSMSLADYKVGFADLLAGHAAVANLLIRLLGHLALDRKTQDMICEEGERANIEHLDCKPSLPVTEAAMQEALRIASSPIVPHVAREDTSIDNFYVPQGSMVLFNNYHLNLSEDLWNNPLDFNPTRFLETCTEDGKVWTLKKPKHFMPFSVGIRECLGRKMVETTNIVLVANLCTKFVIKANDEDLVRRLLAPKGSVALDPDAECFELRLYPRGSR